MKLDHFQQWGRFTGCSKYTLLFAALVVGLPLSVIEGFPTHRLLGGVFQELKPMGILFATIAICGAAWSLMFVQALIIDDVEERWGARSSTDPKAQHLVGGYLPSRAEKFFGVPITIAQVILFFLTALPGLAAIVWCSLVSPLLSIPMAVLGVIVSYFFMILLAAPMSVTDYNILQVPLAKPVFSLAAKLPALKKGVETFREFLSKGIRKFKWLSYLLDDDASIKANHLLALTTAILIALALLVISWLIHPIDSVIAPDWLPPIIYIFLLIMLLVLSVGAFDFHLSRLNVSPMLVLLGIFVLSYWLDNSDHRFALQFNSTTDPSSPTEVVAASRAQENLVVVTATGGGILASAWTTHSLEQMIKSRKQLVDEIRLLSTVSGGSTGAAFFIDGLLRCHADDTCRGKGAVHHWIHENSAETSLAAVGYGFVFRDFLRSFIAPVLSGVKEDRAALLEKSWQHVPTRRLPTDGTPVPIGDTAAHPRMFSNLRKAILAGDIPDLIFNSVVMESGVRLLLTPSAWDLGLDHRRARTLSDYYANGANEGAGQNATPDMSLWTAARLSATFPYVTPAARADWEHCTAAPDCDEGEGSDCSCGHHLIDGGYYDNYGVASAMDWLEPVLRAREKGSKELHFRRVAIVELRSSAARNPKSVKPDLGWSAALLGPISGIVSIGDGAVFERNEIELQRFLDEWNSRLEAQKVELRRFVIQPEENSKGPLSWHLTREALEKMYQAWERGDADEKISNLTNFLNG